MRYAIVIILFVFVVFVLTAFGVPYAANDGYVGIGFLGGWYIWQDAWGDTGFRFQAIDASYPGTYKFNVIITESRMIFDYQESVLNWRIQLP